MNNNGRKRLCSPLETRELAHLGPTGRSGTLDEPTLRVRVMEAFSAFPGSEVQQELMLALLLLWHDHLDGSHAVSQRIPTADGGFIHAIMHRREPDYWNAKYWWRQVGPHPVFEELGTRAGEYLSLSGGGGFGGSVVQNGVWSPIACVDACESVAECPAKDLAPG